jgi:cell division topological specificity factor
MALDFMLLDLFERIFPRATASRQTVKDRLRLVLAHDRTDLPPQLLESMRKEILEVVSRYVELDPDLMEFSLENDQRTTVLIANLPIRRLRNYVIIDEQPVDTTNLEIPDISDGDLDQQVEAISDGNSQTKADSSDENAPVPAAALNDSNGSEAQPNALDAEIALEPADEAEPSNLDLDLSNLDFAPDPTDESKATPAIAEPASEVASSEPPADDAASSSPSLPS